MVVRRATYSGTWYSDSGAELSKQLDGWIEKANVNYGTARAIIVPHAGYQYSGACSGYAYRQINPSVVKRIFILGPCHHVKISSCCLSQTKQYNTPLYPLQVDSQVCADLKATGLFEWADINKEEDEHSIEMQLPFIARVMENYKAQFKIVPILVGILDPQRELVYGKLLSRFLADPKNLFVISSDFCHWGQRFKYMYYDRTYQNIYESIEKLDKVGMDIIEKLNPTKFTEYLVEYRNTICGKYAIGILLQAIQELLKRDNNRKAKLKFLNYTQSNQCLKMGDSSVSYASAVLVVE